MPTNMKNAQNKPKGSLKTAIGPLHNWVSLHNRQAVYSGAGKLSTKRALKRCIIIAH